MSFDGLFMKHLIDELKNNLLYGRLKQIYQVDKDDFLLVFRARKQHTLLISLAPQQTRMHLLDESLKKPSHPPMFCMFLRKHLEGAFLKDIRQQGTDRVATFIFQTKDVLGDQSEKHLVFEALGKDANLILSNDQQVILDAYRHSGPFEGSLRTVMPKAHYKYPKDSRIAFNDARLKQTLNDGLLVDTKDYLQKISGISPLFINEFLFRKNRTTDKDYTVFKTMIDETYYHMHTNKKTRFYCLNLHHLQGETTFFESPSALLEAYFHSHESSMRTAQRAKDLNRVIRKQTEKLKTKIEKLKQDLRKAQNHEQYRRFGELILAHQYAIEKNTRTFTCNDYETGEAISIPLDIQTSPVKNAERYFKKYKKMKRSVVPINKEIDKAKDELEYLRSIESQLVFADDDIIHEIRQELAQLKYIKKDARHSKRKRAQPTQYMTPSGSKILVGRSNLQNESITHELAKSNDVWFHVQNAPGSHVVIHQSFPLDETSLRACAQLAAYFSSLRHSSSVPVDYTEVRYVKKIPGKPGYFVRYKEQKTIYIDPDVDAVNELKKSSG